jgi:hypothetical protein
MASGTNKYHSHDEDLFKHGTAEELYLANKKHYYIDFYHLPTKTSIAFKAYLTSFSDKYSSSWDSEEVYGRMDPIVAFKGTTRTISLEWEVPASSVAEAEENLQRVTALFNMLYPVYGGPEPGAVVSSPPLFRVRFANLIGDQTAPSSAGIPRASSSGVVCSIGGFEYSPEMDDGWFEPATAGVAYPQAIKLSCDMTILHTHSLGYNEADKKLRGGSTKFPYGLAGLGSGVVEQDEQGAPKTTQTGTDATGNKFTK